MVQATWKTLENIEGKIKMDFKEIRLEDMDFIHLAQERDLSLPLVNMVYGSADSVKYRRFLG
jgi:hypothetical protein